MDIYLYVDRDSPLHRLDPRAKLIALIGLLLLDVATEQPWIPGGALLVVLAATHAAGVWRSLRKLRTLLFIISIVSFLSWALFARGTTHVLGPVTIESMLYGLGSALKLASTIAGSMVFLATTKNEEFATGLIRMGVSYNVAFAFSMALRLVPTFVGTGATIVQAQKSRGLDVESGGLVARMRKYLPLVVPIFAGAIRSTNHLAAALESKGFGARKQRSYYLALRLRAADWVWLAVGVLMAVASVYLRFSGFGRIPGLYR